MKIEIIKIIHTIPIKNYYRLSKSLKTHYCNSLLPMASKNGLTGLIRKGLVVLSLALPMSVTGCSYQAPKPSEAESQRVSQLESRLATLEDTNKELDDQLKKNQQEYARTKIELQDVKTERDSLSAERGLYPRSTPEDVVKENKDLRKRIVYNNTLSRLGYKEVLSLDDEVNDLRIENLKLKRQNKNAATYLEKQNIYIGDLTGRELPETESPLGIEKAEHATTKTRLKAKEEEAKQAREQREIDKGKYELDVARLALENKETRLDRDKYKKDFEAWKAKAQELYNYIQQNPRN